MSAAITDPTARLKKYIVVGSTVEFTERFKGLHRGDHIIYHTGYLLADRYTPPEGVDTKSSPTTSPRTLRAKNVHDLAKKAWKAYKDGKVTLIQRRTATFGTFEYHAVVL